MKKIIYSLFTLLFLIGVVLFFSSQNTSVIAQGNQDHVPGNVLVKFKPGTSQSNIDAEVKRNNAKVSSKINALDTLVLKVPELQEEKIVAALSKNPNIEYAELDYLAYATDSPNDTFYAGKQWGLENTGQIIVSKTGTEDADIDAETAWNITTGNSVKVAVLDTGIDQAHPDLSSKIDFNQNFTDSSTIDDIYGHGTHVSGIIAAITNNNAGVAGVCPTCRLLNGKVLNDSGSGAYSWIANGIIWATENNAKVINMSLGGSTKSTTLENAVNYAWSHGVGVVAAAGNSANPSKTYPGAYTNVIAVAATNNLDQKASFSSYGSWVSVAAPGENIYSTFPTHPYTINKSLGYDYGSGTSMATPMAAGVAALIWASDYGTTGNSAVRARLESTADKISGTGSYWAYGRINAGNAVTSSATPTPTPTPIPGSIASVSSITYATFGGKNSDKHLSVTVNLTNESGNPVSGASVSMKLNNSTTSQSWTSSGTTGSNGSLTFTLSNAPSGTYRTIITNVVVSGYTWDTITPSNTFVK